MNTTMADGAAQRLVAQIAADLFGQPGLTLMELAEKVKQARGNDVPLGYVRVEAIKALREDEKVTGVMVHIEERADSVPVYLAARQPVRIYGCCAQPEGELHTAECPNMRHLAARPPEVK